MIVSRFYQIKKLNELKEYYENGIKLYSNRCYDQSQSLLVAYVVGKEITQSLIEVVGDST